MNVLGVCSKVLIPISVLSMSVARFFPSYCIVGCPNLVGSCNKRWIVMTWSLAVTYAKRCIGFGWARTFNCSLDAAGDPATTEVRAINTLIHWSLDRKSVV